MRRNSAPPPVSAIYSGLFELEPSRSQRRIAQIVEGALKSYATVGIENTTYDTIAKCSKMSRQLVLHYFKSKDDIFDMAVKYVRVNFQRVAVEAMEPVIDPKARLEAYVRSTFVWMRDFPTHTHLWRLNFYYCGLNGKLRDLNTELVNMGHERIAALLQRGIEAGYFPAAPEAAVRRRAKHVQNLLMGSLVAAQTERIEGTLDDFASRVVEGCLAIAMSTAP